MIVHKENYTALYTYYIYVGEYFTIIMTKQNFYHTFPCFFSVHNYPLSAGLFIFLFCSSLTIRRAALLQQKCEHVFTLKVGVRVGGEN